VAISSRQATDPTRNASRDQIKRLIQENARLRAELSEDWKARVARAVKFPRSPLPGRRR